MRCQNVKLFLSEPLGKSMVLRMPGQDELHDTNQ